MDSVNFEVIHNGNKKYKTVSDFYKDKIVFITGGTGFLGKILVAKLLNVSDVKEIVLLCRPKKGKSCQERIDEIFSEALFLEIRKTDPFFTKRIRIANGDATLKNLGMDDNDYQYLVDNCNIVIHSAATVKFDDHIKKAFDINVNGTKQILNLSSQVKNLECLVYVSTAYSNCPRDRIVEKFYPSPIPNLEDVEKIGSILDRDEVTLLTEKFIEPWPNTYVFSKAIAENLVKQYDGKMPIAIIRPSIVVATWKDPFPGWVDNLNTVTGVMLGGAIGILRVVLLIKNLVADIVPADIIINCLLCASLKSRNEFFTSDSKKLTIYNVVSGKKNPLSWEEIYDFAMEYFEEFPLKKALWINGDCAAKSLFQYNFFYFLYHFIPAWFIDTALELKGSKLRLIPILKKIKTQFVYLQYFNVNSWDFDDSNTDALVQSIPPEEQKIYDCNIKDVNWKNYFRTLVNGIRVYYLKETDADLVKAKRKRKLHKTLHRIFLTVIYSIYGLLIYFVLKNSNIF